MVLFLVVNLVTFFVLCFFYLLIRSFFSMQVFLSSHSCQKTFFVTFLSKDVLVKFPSKDVILGIPTKKRRQKVVKKTENRCLKDVFWTSLLRLFVVSCPLGMTIKCKFSKVMSSKKSV